METTTTSPLIKSGKLDLSGLTISHTAEVVDKFEIEIGDIISTGVTGTMIVTDANYETGVFRGVGCYGKDRFKIEQFWKLTRKGERVRTTNALLAFITEA